jgi:hypothetical protein
MALLGLYRDSFNFPYLTISSFQFSFFYNMHVRNSLWNPKVRYLLHKILQMLDLSSPHLCVLFRFSTTYPCTCKPLNWSLS